MAIDPRVLAQEVANRLISVPGVAAVVLGGSRARGKAAPDSDIDLGIYYDPATPLSVSDLRAVAEELASSEAASAVTEIGEWGPWINGGAWLEIEGWRVDWLYRDLGRVRRVLDECRAGKTGWHYQAGHPYAFCNHIYLGEVFYCRVLANPDGVLGRPKGLVAEYPPLLKRAILDHLWEAGFALDTARKAATRGDVLYVAGCLFRCAAVLAEVVFALNERYWVNEKGAVQAAGKMDICPERFAERVQGIVGGVRGTAEELLGSVDEMGRLVAEMGRLVEEVGGGLR
jgi:predicted nucleotidyltransferase